MENSEFENFKEISRQIGEDIRYVQGAGGNTSIKLSDKVMMVKASGKWLKNSVADKIFVPVDWQQINRNILDRLEDVLEASAVAGQPSTLRPSIETTLHSLMPRRVVLHTHSVNTIAWAVRLDCPEAIKKKLNGLNWALIEYTKPGFPLTRLVAKALEQQPYDVLIIRNHGLVVGADTVIGSLELMLEVEALLSIDPAIANDQTRTLSAPTLSNTEFKFADSEIINRLASNRLATMVATGGSLYPDHVVFLGSGLIATDTLEGGLAYLGNASDDPLRARAVVVRNQGVLHHRGLSIAGIEMLKAVSEVSRRFSSDATPRYLTRAQELELINWDAEKYRQTLDGS